MSASSGGDERQDLPANFDRLASVYRWMEFLSFGPWLALTRGTFLNRLTDCRHALVLGDGDGRFTARLLRVNQKIKIDAVDSSAAMLRTLVKRAGEDALRVTAHVCDARVWAVPIGDGFEPYDLVTTHFFLDCFTQADVFALATKIKGGMAVEGAWVVSEFVVPAGLFGRLLARPLISGLYWAFGLMTGLAVRKLPDHSAALAEAGLVLRERRVRFLGLLVAEMWCFPQVLES